MFTSTLLCSHLPQKIGVDVNGSSRLNLVRNKKIKNSTHWNAYTRKYFTKDFFYYCVSIQFLTFNFHVKHYNIYTLQYYGVTPTADLWVRSPSLQLLQNWNYTIGKKIFWFFFFSSAKPEKGTDVHPTWFFFCGVIVNIALPLNLGSNFTWN